MHNFYHKPTAAYSLWVNRTNAQLIREILAVLRTLLVDLKLTLRAWTSIINILPIFINDSPIELLGRNDLTRSWTILQDIGGMKRWPDIIQITRENVGPVTSGATGKDSAAHVADINHLGATLDRNYNYVWQRAGPRTPRQLMGITNWQTNSVRLPFVVEAYFVASGIARTDY